VGKYAVEASSFEALALPTLTNLGPSVRLVVIDEVGRMELVSRSFMPAVRRVLDAAGAVVLGTVPLPRYGFTIPEVGRWGSLR